jgi:vacuolar-type H+-ATPase subunit F/Vma7
MVAIVIITQDRKEQLRKTLDSFKKYNPKNFFVVIIDDKMNDCKGLPKYKFKVHVLSLLYNSF